MCASLMLIWMISIDECNYFFDIKKVRNDISASNQFTNSYLEQKKITGGINKIFTFTENGLKNCKDSPDEISKKQGK